jgi:hypothetical protein
LAVPRPSTSQKLPLPSNDVNFLHFSLNQSMSCNYAMSMWTPSEKPEWLDLCASTAIDFPVSSKPSSGSSQLQNCISQIHQFKFT